MPRPHPRLQRGAHLLDDIGDVRDWAPPGWHWEVSPSGGRSLMRISGPATDPDHIWWQPMGPGPNQYWCQRERAPKEVVRHRIREEDAHIRRYLAELDRNYSNTWSFIQRVPNPNMSFAPVRVPYIWACSAPRSGPRGLGPGRS